jgi:hypothetical protein
LEIGSVRRGLAWFPPWTIQVRFELLALAYFYFRARKYVENESNLSFLAQTIQKLRPVEVKIYHSQTETPLIFAKCEALLHGRTAWGVQEGIRHKRVGHGRPG